MALVSPAFLSPLKKLVTQRDKLRGPMTNIPLEVAGNCGNKALNLDICGSSRSNRSSQHYSITALSMVRIEVEIR